MDALRPTVMVGGSGLHSVHLGPMLCPHGAGEGRARTGRREAFHTVELWPRRHEQGMTDKNVWRCHLGLESTGILWQHVALLGA